MITTRRNSKKHNFRKKGILLPLAPYPLLLVGLLLVIFYLSFSPTRAQTSVTSTYQFGAGESRLLDTYLSQEEFSGSGLTFLYTSERRKPERHWTTVWQHEVSRCATEDRAASVSETLTEYTMVVGKRRNWQFGGLRLQAGGVLSFNLGALQNSANSNNPVSARHSLQLMPSAKASHDFELVGLPFTLHYEVQLPLVGEMFTPNYGQSYYEVFSLGNYDRNVVLTTFVSTPNLRQLLSLDAHVPRFATLRVSYLGNYQQSKVNGLKTHVYNSMVMVGIVKEFDIVKK